MTKLALRMLPIGAGTKRKRPNVTSRKRPVIGDALREARVAIRFTQTAFVDELGISRRTLSRWEQGDVIPEEFQRPWIVTTVMGFDGEAAKRLAEKIGVTVSPASGGRIASNAHIGAAVSLGVDVVAFGTSS